MDFTPQKFEYLLQNFKYNGYAFLTLDSFLSLNKTESNLPGKVIILRHDVEVRYKNALKLAQIESLHGIKGSFYFRIYPQKENETIISKIASLGHEIGYHYDDVSYCKGNMLKALERFCNQIAYLRQFGPISTITMEGAPLSRYDNRSLWRHFNLDDCDAIIKVIQDQEIREALQKFCIPKVSQNKKDITITIEYVDYKALGLKGEPYFDLDYQQIFYLTDTGRCWNGNSYNIRDKVPEQHHWMNRGYSYHSTNDIIKAIEKGHFPSKAIITFHPQRWNDNFGAWSLEFVGQTLKNQIKRIIVAINS